MEKENELRDLKQKYEIDIKKLEDEEIYCKEIKNSNDFEVFTRDGVNEHKRLLV